MAPHGHTVPLPLPSHTALAAVPLVAHSEGKMSPRAPTMPASADSSPGHAGGLVAPEVTPLRCWAWCWWLDEAPPGMGLGLQSPATCRAVREAEPS